MPQNIIVIGAVALGPKAACRFKRLCPEDNVIMIDQSDRISYGGCGIPYYISGEVNRLEDLQTTPYNVIRDPNFFHANKGVTVLTRTRVESIDRSKKTVCIRRLETGELSELPYDKLVLGMGSAPNRPPIKGLELHGVHTCTTLEDAHVIREPVAGGSVNGAVVVGGGFIGLEVAVALADMWGIKTSVVEIADQILPGFLSKTMVKIAEHDMAQNNVDVFCGEKVLAIEGENGSATRVITDKRVIEAELVIMAAGIRPHTDIAAKAGIEVNERGAIVVNDKMQTSDPHIYAGGDCVTIPNLITGKPGFYPLGSMANRQGRVIGTNLAGGNARFHGGVGTWAVKLFEQNAAGAGLTIDQAVAAEFDAVNVHVEAFDRAHFYPEKTIMALDLVVERPTRRVLGIQGTSSLGDALVARINAVAPLLKYKPVIEDISNLEVAYSPPFASAMDVINTVGNVADNILAGRNHALDPDQFAVLWQDRASGKYTFVDTRLTPGAAPLAKKYPGQWLSIPQEELEQRLDELPTDRTVVLICNTGLRSFESQLIMNRHNRASLSVQGGMTSVLKQGMII